MSRVRRYRASRLRELQRLATTRRRLDEQSKRLVDLDRNRAELYSKLAIDVRTPLTLAIGPLQSAISSHSSEISDELLGQLSIILRNARQLVTLLDRLADMPRLDTNSMEPVPTPGTIGSSAPLRSVPPPVQQSSPLLVVPPLPPLPEVGNSFSTVASAQPSPDPTAGMDLKPRPLPARPSAIPRTPSIAPPAVRASASTPSRSIPPPANAEPDLVLVVDDNPDIREFVRLGLRKVYRIAQAVDGEDGLTKARELMPSLIISDVMMPKLDGKDMCRMIKSDDRLRHIPVILLTAKADEEMRVEGLESGANDYLTKPFSIKELAARVKNHLRVRAHEKALRTSNEQLEEKLREQLNTIMKSGRLLKYFPKKLVDRILYARDDIALVSEHKNVTIFFSDLTGFTRWTERTDAHQITRLLNAYFAEMTSLIEAHGGILDKFIGDGIMALFGATDEMDPTDQATNAVAMAAAMQKRMRILHETWVREGIEADLRIRMGIHQGVVTVGNFGSKDLVEYTAIGSGVNLASRLEATCTPGRVRVSEAVHALTSNKFPYGPTQLAALKGFDRPIAVWEVDPSSMPDV